MKRRNREAIGGSAAAIAPLPAVATTVAPDPFREIRWLIWLYFGLLLLEGALRKWVVPSLANPLLIIRDPVLLLIYGIAFSRRVFPTNGFVLTMLFLGVSSYLISFVSMFGDWRVGLFGLRCNFLHLPLIFIIGRAFSYKDVRRIGWWMLALSVPMAAIMALQFQSSGDAWINRGAGEDASMITSINGRIRPSGTFSFVSGIIYFYALTMAFLVYGIVQKRTYPWWLIVAAGGSLPVALAVSSSRSTVAACGLVLGALVVAIICRPSLALKATKLFVIGFILASVVGGMALFRQGMETFTARVEHASDVEGGAEGFVHRFTSQFTHPLEFMFTVPIAGYGLGSGTNVGAKLLTGEIEFLLAEDEWERVMLESGPLFGFSYLILRTALTIWLALLAWRSARAGHFLPMLLVGACAWPLVSGQFGQTTTLGFAVSIAGIALASLRIPQAAMALAPVKPRRAVALPQKVQKTWAAIESRKQVARGKLPPKPITETASAP